MSPAGEPARQWGEKEWQAYANALLSVHHSLRNESYQRVDDAGGDHGLEGFTDKGDAYQCYADQDSKSLADRTRKQKDKTNDLLKLDTYKDFWADIFGTGRIRHWTLLVPKTGDKTVLQFARKKGRELVAKGLSFIASDLEVCVKTAEDFPNAKLIAKDPHIHLPNRAPPSPGDVATFKSKAPEFVQTIADKLEKVHSGATARNNLLHKLLRWHLDSSNVIEDLHAKFPYQWEALEALIAKKGESIETESLIIQGKGRERLTAVRREFAESLKAAHNYLPEVDLETVSWGTVAKWLGQCFLNFPDEDE